ncbi:MAG: CorA family divalent cation transporter [Hydrogenoanaerobacterium sp.]
MNKVLLQSEADGLGQYIDDITLLRIKSKRPERFESLDNSCLISFDVYNILETKEPRAQLIIYFSKAHLFFICENEKLREAVQNILNEYPENDKTLLSFFNELTKSDMEYMEKFEDRITTLEDNLLLGNKVHCAQKIVIFRKELIRLGKYYEPLDSIFEDLTQNEDGLISATQIKSFIVLGNRLDRLHSTVLHLRDFVTQVREAYQEQIEIEQNGIMKIFTVITTIFAPLTLIVGWYGMNLHMPEYSWQYGYPLAIVLSLAVSIATIAAFKYKKWF